MSDTTTHLGLPYLLAAQAQKHVTVNEALRILDGLVQLSVIEARASPPASPAPGARYLVTATAAGAWQGWEDSIALLDDNAWRRLVPQSGWFLWNVAAAEFQYFDGAAWVALETGTDVDFASGEIEALGIATAADATNRLAVAAPAVLLTHTGAGHQLKINKAAAGDTASVLFQSNLSGRAEVGLAGEDDFSFKVSPDGAAWETALAISAATGIPNLRAGATIGGSLAYRRANILGGVSQSGGVPTGAAIERGNNANGQFVRYADGTQICWQHIASFASTEIASGSIWMSEEGTWTFPAAFSAAPTCSGNVRSSAAARWLNARPAGTTNAAIRVLSSVSSTGAVIVDMLAVGRWF
jgi:hypothetical protein